MTARPLPSPLPLIRCTPCDFPELYFIDSYYDFSQLQSIQSHNDYKLSASKNVPPDKEEDAWILF